MIEKYTKNARFCLICNYVSKIIPGNYSHIQIGYESLNISLIALQSRCTRFRFAPLSESQVADRIQHIATLEKYGFHFKNIVNTKSPKTNDIVIVSR